MTEPDNASMRASDADREAVAERLRTAQSEGRLNIAEYDERLRIAYGAVTMAELAPLTTDLPVSTPRTAVAHRASLKKLPKEWRSWGSTACVLITIWLVSSIGAGGPVFFWPIFPLGIWGAVLVSRLLFGGDDEDSGDKDSGDNEDSGDREPGDRKPGDRDF